MAGLGNGPDEDLNEKPSGFLGTDKLYLTPETQKNTVVIDELSGKPQLPSDTSVHRLDKPYIEKASLLLNGAISGESVKENKRLNPNGLTALLYEPNNVGFVVTSNDRIMGTLVGYQKGPNAYIKWIATEPNFAGKEEIIRLLILEFEKWARNNYSTSVRLDLRTNGVPKSVYNDIGYRPKRNPMSKYLV